MDDCLFCKIAAGQIPSNKLYEDDQLLAFYDIDPQAPTHFLVIPKQHIDSAAALTESDAALLGHIYAVIADLCRQLGVLVGGCGIRFNSNHTGHRLACQRPHRAEHRKTERAKPAKPRYGTKYQRKSSAAAGYT